MLGAESLARARRITREVMEALSSDGFVRNPMERVAVHAAVDRYVTSLIETGEKREKILKTKTLKMMHRRDLS